MNSSEGHRLQTPCGDGSLVWHVWGDAKAPPLVLLHGGSGSWTHWARNVDALAAAGWRVVVPDLPGFGDSAAPAGVRDADGMVEPVRQGLVQVVGDAPVTVVGFSFGSMVGALLAAQQPAMVKRLVIVGAPGLGLRDSRLKLYDWRHLTAQAERDAVHRRNLGILMLHDASAIDEATLRLHAHNLDRDRMRRRRLALTDILARTVPTLACRVDAIYGAEDALYADTMPELQRLLRGWPNLGELVLIAGGGHWVQYEKAAEFNAQLLRILR
jgi:pimeloyl-ACP methyl ester carboxylesterase